MPLHLVLPSWPGPITITLLHFVEMLVTTMGVAPLIAHTHVCMCCILYWLHYNLDENGAARNGGSSNLTSRRERFYEPEYEITSVSEIPNEKYSCIDC